MNAEAVPVLASELYMMDSVHTGRTYRISISLPLVTTATNHAKNA